MTQEASPTLPPAPLGTDYLYSEAARALKEQLDWIDALDTKAGILLAADGVIAGLVISRDSLLNSAPPAVGVVVVALVAASLILSLLCFGTRNYELGPDVNELLAHATASEEELKWAVFPTILSALDINQPKLDLKSRFLSGASVSLLLGAAVLAAYYLYFLVSS